MCASRGAVRVANDEFGKSLVIPPPTPMGGGWPGAEQAKAETAGGIDSSGAALEQAKAETGVARLYGAPLWVWRAT